MTWIGKILSVLVLLLALVWMWFTVSLFAARTNWKVQADTYKKAFDDARKAREAEYRDYQTAKDAYDRQVLTAETRIKGLADQVAKLQTDANANADALAAANKIIKDSDIKAVELGARIQAMTDEVQKTRDRNNSLEDERVVLVVKKEQAEKDRQAAENLAKQAAAQKLLADARVESLTAQLAEARSTGGSSTATVINSFTRPPAPLPEGVRGTVTAYGNGYVVLSIGIDAGLTNGAVLDVYRTEGGGDYLGTVVIQTVHPKEAVGQFKPKDERIPISRLRPEQLPKVGDLVGKVGNISQRP